ncbi:MAG: hypothetical protein K1X54_07725 [Flavobacteriales bacterium]|nr:hypothetical protein [Flavobacteriales bacterium]
MKDLNSNWITEGLMDFEYKKYVLLAYLKSCRESFEATRLYPPLGSLVKHYHDLTELNKSLEQLTSSFPKELSGFDFNKLRLEYQQEKLKDESISTITEVVEFALPNLKETIEEGRSIYELVEKNIEIQPVGIMPMYSRDGYVMVHVDHTTDIHVFQYQHSVIVSSEENLRSLSLQYISKEVKSITNTFEQIKLKLIATFRDIPQPATFLCISKMEFPLMETLVPVTKRLLLTKVLP